MTHPLLKDLEKVLVSEEAIEKRTHELGQTITAHCTQANIDLLTVICITNGAIFFTADLLRQIPIHTHLECIRISSYKNSTQAVQTPEILGKLQTDIRNQHVLIIDDILDTGRTCLAIIKALETHKPASIKTCMLLDKKERREVSLEADYLGFQIPNAFVVGYGLDFAQRYRNLPCIGVLKSELQP